MSRISKILGGSDASNTPWPATMVPVRRSPNPVKSCKSCKSCSGLARYEQDLQDEQD